MGLSDFYSVLDRGAQPPDLEKDFQGISQNLNRVIPFSPPWPVLCLRQYFEDRTRHIASYLDTGFTPDFDTAGGSMVAVVKSMSNLTGEDRAAIAAYVKAVPAAE